MKKLKFGIASLALLTIIGFNVYTLSSDSTAKVSLAPLEAEAQPIELPGVTIECSNSGWGQCYKNRLVFPMLPCKFTGIESDYCA